MIIFTLLKAIFVPVSGRHVMLIIELCGARQLSRALNSSFTRSNNMLVIMVVV